MRTVCFLAGLNRDDVAVILHEAMHGADGVAVFLAAPEDRQVARVEHRAGVAGPLAVSLVDGHFRFALGACVVGVDDVKRMHGVGVLHWCSSERQCCPR